MPPANGAGTDKRTQLPARPEQNHLIRLLPPDVARDVASCSECIAVPARYPIAEPYQDIPYAYFPTSCVLSVVKPMADGRAVEVLTVGCEGMTGLTIALGGSVSPLRCFAQVSGGAVRIPAADFRGLYANHAALREALAAYTEAVLLQIAQNVACNQLHNVEQRCARWLLTTGDRAGTDDVALTHEFLAVMLGVRRATVTDVEAELRAKGLIGASRGQVRIIDRVGLEAVACECYETTRAEFRRLLDNGVRAG